MLSVKTKDLIWNRHLKVTNASSNTECKLFSNHPVVEPYNYTLPIIKFLYTVDVTMSEEISLEVPSIPYRFPNCTLHHFKRTLGCVDHGTGNYTPLCVMYHQLLKYDTCLLEPYVLYCVSRDDDTGILGLRGDLYVRPIQEMFDVVCRNDRVLTRFSENEN